MKKIFIAFLLMFFSLCFSSVVYAESYYFKGCKLSTAVLADYIIDFDKNLIKVSFISIDGKVQNFTDKIKLIEKNQIVSEKIKSGKGVKIYYQYFLNSESNSVTKLQFKRESGIDIDIFKLVEKKESFCMNVKADWNKNKIENKKASNEQKEILKIQEKLSKEQSSIIECEKTDYTKWTNCKGIYKTNTGHKYSGIFKNGTIIKGKSIYPGGANYTGEFKNFEPHGYGTFVWTNGDKYYGQWKNGKSDGNGTKIWKDGRKYAGTFKNDKLHGKGTLTYPDGKKYVGEFLNGKRHGEGTFTYPDGTAYIGKFIAGNEQDEGICIAKDGSSIKCGSEAETQTKDFSGKDTHNISIVSKKWVRISQYENNTKKGKKVMDKLKIDFNTKASEVCSKTGNFNILTKNIEVLASDDTPAYGLETKLKLGIRGVIECI